MIQSKVEPVESAYSSSVLSERHAYRGDRQRNHRQSAGHSGIRTRENELATTQAEAAKKIAEAEGDAKSR